MTIQQYYQAQENAFLAGLIEWLKIPSISTLPERKPEVRQAAEFIARELREIGLRQVELIEGQAGQNPLIYGEWLDAPGKPTLLLYGHYDVQPPDPWDEWSSPPFEPTARGNDLFARGASDDKGQTYILVKAVEGFLRAEGRLPINVKFLIEGEEEVGGQHIESYVAGRPARLQCDAALVCDTEMFAPGLPTLTTGLRGLVYTEIEARGAAQDLHSGLYGGAAPNPIQALAQILAGLKRRDGRIAIPGFYRRVERPSRAELAAWRNLPFSEKAFLKTEVGARALVGEKGYTVLERIWARPTLEVHGIRGGFTGEGAKTVIPAAASAKVSMRLVPAMRPSEAIQQYRAAVKRLTPPGIRTTVRVLASSPACLVSTDSRFIQAAAQALEQIFGRKTVYIRAGGSIPVVGLFDRYLRVPTVLMGFGLPDDRLHSPNEKFHLPNFYRGIESVGRYLQLLGEA